MVLRTLWRRKTRTLRGSKATGVCHQGDHGGVLGAAHLVDSAQRGLKSCHFKVLSGAN